MKRMMTVAGMLAMAGTAMAQSVYVDIDATSGVGSGLPNPVFGGPAGIPGQWNAVYTTSPATVPLVGTAGQATGVTLARALTGAFAAANSASTSGYCESLLDDYQFIASGSLTYTFNGLEPGNYMVFVCGIMPGSTANRSAITINSPFEAGQTTQSIGGSMATNTFKAGVTHAVLAKHISAGGSLTVTASSGFQTSAIVSGIQVVKVDDAGGRFRLYVNDNAAGSNDGGSWAGAYTDLQSALATAALAGGGNCEVWVSTGFYEPTPGTDRSATFSVAPGLRLLGGFAGTESTLAQRANPLGNLTYLTGSIGGSGNADDSYTVVTLDQADSDTLVDGFYIARGSNDGAGPNSGHGGGMAIVGGGVPTIRNCDFTTNRAASGGGALYVHNCMAQIVGCTFYNNDAPNGAGGAIEATSTVTTTANVHNCKFLGNSAIGDGGAIYSSGIYLTAANCFFSGNTSSSEAGAIKSTGTTQSLTLVNCTLSKNSSQGSVGGVYASGGLDIDMHNSILWGNTAALPGNADAKQITTQTFAGSTWSGSFNTIEGISADPKFVDADGANNVAGGFDDDCRLSQGSPCVDAGDATFLPLDYGDVDSNGNAAERIPVDVDGRARRVEIPWMINTGPAPTPVIDRGAYEMQTGEWCYANCDNSAAAPTLNALDFSCFLQRFGAGDAYANCDGSATPPVLNVLDFSCFLQKFATGCP